MEGIQINRLGEGMETISESMAVHVVCKRTTEISIVMSNTNASIATNLEVSRIFAITKIFQGKQTTEGLYTNEHAKTRHLDKAVRKFGLRNTCK